MSKCRYITKVTHKQLHLHDSGRDVQRQFTVKMECYDSIREKNITTFVDGKQHGKADLWKNVLYLILHKVASH